MFIWFWSKLVDGLKGIDFRLVRQEQNYEVLHRLK